MNKQAYWEKYYPEFVAVTDKNLKSLMASAMLVEIPAGEQVFYPGKQCENYVLLLEGRIKIQLMSESGREILLYCVNPGDSCVLTTSCLLGSNQYPAEAFTEADSKAFVIPSTAFHRCLESSAFFREFVFQNMSSRLSNVIGRMEHVLFASVENRLAELLLALSSDQNQIAKTHQDLAAELGTAREVVSRHLKRFEKFGWIHLSRGSIQVKNPHALAELSGAL
jgi:CRP/FNR family transcriptional regulator